MSPHCEFRLRQPAAESNRLKEGTPTANTSRVAPQSELLMGSESGTLPKSPPIWLRSNAVCTTHNPQSENDNSQAATTLTILMAPCAVFLCRYGIL